jgi:hypothetical protein
MPDADHVVPTHEVTRERQPLLLLTTVLAVVMHWLYATAAGRPAGPMSNGALGYAMDLWIATAMLSAPSGDRRLWRRFGVSAAIRNSIGSRERGGAGCRSQRSVANSGVADIISQHSKQVGTFMHGLREISPYPALITLTRRDMNELFKACRPPGMRWSMRTTAQKGWRRTMSAGINYLEIYEGDVLSADMQPVLEYAASLFRQSRP